MHVPTFTIQWSPVSTLLDVSLYKTLSIDGHPHVLAVEEALEAQVNELSSLVNLEV